MQPLGRILARLELSPGPLLVRKVHETLRGRFGAAEAGRVRVGRVRRGRLILEVHSAAQACEWAVFRKAELLEAFAGEPELRHIHDLEIRIGSGGGDG